MKKNKYECGKYGSLGTCDKLIKENEINIAWYKWSRLADRFGLDKNFIRTGEAIILDYGHSKIEKFDGYLYLNTAAASRVEAMVLYRDLLNYYGEKVIRYENVTKIFQLKGMGKTLQNIWDERDKLKEKILGNITINTTQNAFPQQQVEPDRDKTLFTPEMLEEIKIKFPNVENNSTLKIADNINTLTSYYYAEHASDLSWRKELGDFLEYLFGKNIVEKDENGIYQIIKISKRSRK